MKKIFFAAFPVLALALLLKPNSEPLPIGAALPNPSVKLKDISGKEVSFKDAMGEKGLLVMFSCNTCPIVEKYEQRTVEACKTALSKKIGVILLNSNEATRGKGDSYDDMKAYARKLNYNFHYVVDEKSAMADAFGANRTPECFLFDNTGKLVYHGAIDDNPSASDASKPYLKLALEGVATGGKIEPENTRSVGCTIKRQ